MKANMIELAREITSQVTTREELSYLYGVMKQVATNIDQQAARLFVQGERVKFVARGRLVFARVDHTNVRSVACTEEGTRTKWKVSPTLLEHADEGEGV